MKPRGVHCLHRINYQIHRINYLLYYLLSTAVTSWREQAATATLIVIDILSTPSTDTSYTLYIYNMCIPLICGFPTKVKQDGDAGRMCPRCNNPAVMSAASRTWFEFFWIPLIPFTKSHIWVCGICQWEMKQGDGPDPQPPQGWNQRPPQHHGGMH